MLGASFFTVEQRTAAIAQRLGKFMRGTPAGLRQQFQEASMMRDAERDENCDAELSYESSVGQSHGPIRARADIRDETRDRKRDKGRDAKRDESRDSERDQLRDAARDRRRDKSTGNATSSFAHDEVPLIVAMAEECGDLIAAWDKAPLDQPASLRLKHLQWMCNRVAKQADNWPKTKLHRWIGFIQAGMIANRLLRLDDARRMFDEAKKSHPGLDQDLLDHLDPKSSFELDIGGEG